MADDDIDKLDFEEALTKLEGIVRELEAGRIKLDTAVAAYEEAMTLKKFCEEKLHAAKLKIEKIVMDTDNKISLSSLDDNDE